MLIMVDYYYESLLRKIYYLQPLAFKILHNEPGEPQDQRSMKYFQQKLVFNPFWHKESSWDMVTVMLADMFGLSGLRGNFHGEKNRERFTDDTWIVYPVDFVLATCEYRDAKN